MEPSQQAILIAIVQVHFFTTNISTSSHGPLLLNRLCPSVTMISARYASASQNHIQHSSIIIVIDHQWPQCVTAYLWILHSCRCKVDKQHEQSLLWAAFAALLSAANVDGFEQQQDCVQFKQEYFNVSWYQLSKLKDNHQIWFQKQSRHWCQQRLSSKSRIEV